MQAEEALGRVIQERRLLVGMSQLDLASATGLHKNFVSLVERGETGVSLESLGQIARALRCPERHLMEAAKRLTEGA